MTCRAWLLAGVALLLAGCYRPTPPAELDEGVRLVFTANEGRYVRAQGYLAEEIAQALVLKNGWRVSPTGSATLAIALQEERIASAGRSDDDIILQQRIRLRGTALLTTRSGSLTTPFSGEVVVGSPGEEPNGLRAAARNCATTISEWLAVQAETLRPGSQDAPRP